MSPAIFLGQHQVLGFQRQFPPFRHSIPGIDGQVHQDLFHLTRIRFDVFQVFGKEKLEVDIFLDQPAKHLGVFPDEVI